MSSVPAKQNKFEVDVYVDRTVKPQVQALLPGGEADWPAFKVALLAAVLDKPGLQPAIAQNPTSALVSIVKCARLGLSLNPIDCHFALVPKGGAIHGWVQYQGWLHLAMSSGAFEHVIADVIYRQEVQANMPLLDPVTNKPNHWPNELMRDQYKDDDIVGAYCALKPKGHERYITRVLSRKNLDKRRAMGASQGEAYTKWMATMFRGKAIQACCKAPEVPKTPRLAEALRMAAEEDAVEERRQEARTPIPALPPAPKTGDEILFDGANEQPLPEDAELRDRLLKAIDVEADKRSVSPEDLLEIAREIASDVCGVDVKDLKSLSPLALEQVFEKVKER